MTPARQWHSVDEIRANHDGHWFDRDTMRFFRSRLGDDVIGGRYFISSEQYDDSSPRLYTIREASSDARIATVGEFQGYATRKLAESAARKLPADYSASLMATLTSDLHNGTGWIVRASQLARYTGKPLDDCKAVIHARALARRRAKASR